MGEKKFSKLHWILGIGLIVLGIIFIIAIIVVSSQAQSFSVPAQTSINNVAPTVSQPRGSTVAYAYTNDYWNNFSVPEAGLTVNFNGTVTDLNGYLDIDNVLFIFYRNSTSQANCKAGSTDNNYCYQVASCDTANGSGTTLDFNCVIDLQYWIDATDVGTYSGSLWYGAAFASDGLAEGSFIRNFGDVLSTLSMGFATTTMDWGSLAFGDETGAGNNVDFTYVQTGNTQVEPEVSMTQTGLNCTSGDDIPRANIEYDLNDDGWATGGTSITATPIAPGNVQLGLRTDEGTPVTGIDYWDIKIPASNLGGICSGTIIINGVAWP